MVAVAACGSGAQAAVSVTSRRNKEDKKPGLKSQLSSRLSRAVAVENRPVLLQKFHVIWSKQKAAEDFYTSSSVQYTVATIIFANFIGNIVEKQIDPFGENYPDQFLIMEDIFNYIFLVELVINMYAFWFLRFWRSGWNVFDVIVVTAGVLSLARVELPEPASMLRMLRAFRVFRLFKRVKSLNKIIVSLFNAVPGILNASFVMLLVMCIYAILGVEFFGKFGVEDGTYINDLNLTVSAVTTRELHYGTEYWGTFMAALLTLFQVLTGESWAEVVARPLIFGMNKWSCGLYFVSFILICSIVLINVVVAVLLEKCIGGDDEEPPEEEGEEGDDQLGELETVKPAIGRITAESSEAGSGAGGAAGGDDGGAKVEDLLTELAAVKKELGNLLSVLDTQSKQISELRAERADAGAGGVAGAAR